MIGSSHSLKYITRCQPSDSSLSISLHAKWVGLQANFSATPTPAPIYTLGPTIVPPPHNFDKFVHLSDVFWANTMHNTLKSQKIYANFSHCQSCCPSKIIRVIIGVTSFLFPNHENVCQAPLYKVIPRVTTLAYEKTAMNANKLFSFSSWSLFQLSSNLSATSTP